MPEIPEILVVYFDAQENAKDGFGYGMWRGGWPGFDADGATEWLGLPLLIHKSRPVANWSTDMVTCKDERWVAFGPFDNQPAAKEALESLPQNSIIGYRLVGEHCFNSHYKRQLHIYTDG